MNSRRSILPGVLFLLEAAGLSAYVVIFIQSGTYTILDHGFRLSGSQGILFLGLWAGFFSGLAFGAKKLAGFEARRWDQDPADRLKQTVIASVPLTFLLLTPALNVHYLIREDLQTRHGLLGLFVILAVFGLKLHGLLPLLKTKSGQTGTWRTKFERLPLRKRLTVLFVAAFLVYNLCAFVLVGQDVTFSGDEPNYLLTSHSLLYDKDINLANNYANQDYFHFYSRQDNPNLRLGVYGQYGKKGETYIYPINLPGISVLMLPWYWLSQAFSGRWLTFILKGSLSIWAVLLGLQIYLLARDLWRREGLALTVWALYAFSAPVLFYALHLYPEIPIALFSIYIYRKLMSGRALRPATLLFMGFLLGTFSWFGLKYNFIFWPLFLVALYVLWKSQRPRSTILAFLVFPVFGTALFYYFVYTLYGTASPFAVYEGIITPERAQALKAAWLDYPLWARTDSFFDYFLDQRDGLLLYAPFYFFMFLGLVELFRKSKRDLAVLLFVTLPFLLNYAFFTHRQGFCPQGRVLTPLSWAGALFIGYFLANNTSRVFGFLFRAAAAATAAITVLLLVHPSFLYQTTTHEVTERAGEFFIFLSNLNTFLPRVLPSFIKIRNLDYLPNYLWIGGVILAVGLYAMSRHARTRPAGRAFAPIAALVLLGAAFTLWIYFPRTVLYPARTLTYATERRLGFYLYPLGSDVVAKNQGELYLHAARPYRVLFGSRKRLDSVKLVFGSEKGDHDVALREFDLPLFEGRTIREKKEFVFSPRAVFPWRNLFIYEIDFDFHPRTGENLKIDPYLLQIIPVR